MNHDSLSESFEEENIISRASPKSYEQPGQPSRSRFSILADMNEVNTMSKKTEEKSLLSRYMKDLHDEQPDNPPKTALNQVNLRECQNDPYVKDNRKAQQVRNRQSIQYDWKRKNGAYFSIQNVENVNKLNQNLEKSKSIKKQSESYGIFVYKMKIDLNKPIDFSLQQHQNIHRTYGQPRNSSKLFVKEKTEEDMLFGKALKQQHHYPKNTRY